MTTVDGNDEKLSSPLPFFHLPLPPASPLSLCYIRLFEVLAAPHNRACLQSVEVVTWLRSSLYDFVCEEFCKSCKFHKRTGVPHRSARVEGSTEFDFRLLLPANTTQYVSISSENKFFSLSLISFP